MRCYYPISGYRRANGTVKFHERRGDTAALEIQCGRCIGCRLGRAQEWAVRAMHEAQMHERSSFVTLTYADEEIPEHGSLNYRDVQLWLKRARKELSERERGKLRYICAGEYGAQTQRPHYHLLLYGEDYRHDAVGHGKDTWTSKTLDELWEKGHAVIGALTPQSAGYVARYALKKKYGAHAEAAYTTIDFDTGEIAERRPEFLTSSRRPGIGATWFDRFKRDLYPQDAAIFNGRKVPVPRYYRRRLAELDPLLSEEVEYKRYLRSLAVPAEERTEERRAVAAQVKKAATDHHTTRGL